MAPNIYVWIIYIPCDQHVYMLRVWNMILYMYYVYIYIHHTSFTSSWKVRILVEPRLLRAIMSHACPDLKPINRWLVGGPSYVDSQRPWAPLPVEWLMPANKKIPVTYLKADRCKERMRRTEKVFNTWAFPWFPCDILGCLNYIQLCEPLWYCSVLRMQVALCQSWVLNIQVAM